MTPQFSRLASWSAYLSVAATWLGFILLVLFFSIGQPFGTLNDTASVLQVLFMIPVAIALHRLAPVNALQPSLATAVIGIGAMSIIAVLQSLIAINPALYPVLTGAVLVAGGGLGVWLVLANYLCRQYALLPNRLAWLGIITGLSYVVLVIGFLLSGQENILFGIGSLMVIIIYPIWAIWLGRRLLLIR